MEISASRVMDFDVFGFFSQLFVVYWRYHSKHCLNSRSGGYKNLSLQKWDFDVYVPYVENN